VTVVRVTLEYDGTGFSGWAAQPGLRTVEGELRAALDELYVGWGGLAVAGRTDAGVHALGQVASFEAEGGPPPERAAAALNGVLPDDVAAVASEAAPAGFSARFSATGRSYRYRVWRREAHSPLELRRSLWHPRPVDEEALAASAALLAGEHDFRAFTPTETQHDSFVRVVRAAGWERDGHVLAFTITADSFLRHMVRTLVGTMLEQSPEELERLLGGRPRADAGATAPPWGLYLEQAHYQG
jgi:tRNA pseudouridine38-40 synthase